MYRMIVLSENWEAGQQIALWVKMCCGTGGIFPHIDVYEDIELFYQEWKPNISCTILVDLPGVTGLNEVEHIRSLCRECGLIWCSNLDFSLQAFRLRVDYFLLSPVNEQKMQEAISVWIRNRKQNIWLSKT